MYFPSKGNGQAEHRDAQSDVEELRYGPSGRRTAVMPVAITKQRFDMFSALIHRALVQNVFFAPVVGVGPFGLVGLGEQEISQDQIIHFRAHKAAVGVFRAYTRSAHRAH
jgi:hypothetical protein